MSHMHKKKMLERINNAQETVNRRG